MIHGEEKDFTVNLSIVNIKEGAAVEMFDRALQKVLININDINTTLAKREILLKMELLPSEDRTLVEINFGVSTKLAGQGGQKLTADVKIDERGRAYAKERKVQHGLPFGNVTSIERKGE